MHEEIKYGHYEGTSTTPYLDRTKTVYTQEGLDKAVKAEREACALVCDKIADEKDFGIGLNTAIECVQTIRKRNK